MMWHMIVNIGPADIFAPNISQTDPRVMIAIDNPTSPWYVGNDIERIISLSLQCNPNSLNRDLIRLAVAVYVADLRVPRKRTEDRWTRDMTLYMPVVDVASWNKSLNVLLKLLNFLTGDRWNILFREMSETKINTEYIDSIDSVCLFSGGLDSLVGAIDLLTEGKRVALVSHHGLGDGTKSIQERIVEVLRQEFSDQIFHVPFFLHPNRGNTDEGENTMRARSFLFMAVGIAVASMVQTQPALTVPENGLISLNVPLTGARTGSLSTRTTHPYYMELFRKLLIDLEIHVPITLPFRHLTKGEMLTQSKHQDMLKKTVALTMSCSHPTVGRYAGITPGNHCGYCVPCIIRFASIKASGMVDRKPDWDVVTSPSSAKSSRAQDVRAFMFAIERLKGTNPTTDVFRILRSGPIPSDEARALAAVYRRGMTEVAAFLGIPFP